MRRYLGRKIVTATPMTRAVYNTYRNWTLPADEDGSDEGYLVEYQDGAPNVAGHAGYVSWSPAAQFDASHIELPAVPGMAPHQQRVLDEQHELAIKIAALDKFAAGPVYTTLPIDEQIRLVAQSDAMKVYSNVLLRRIAAFQ